MTESNRSDRRVAVLAAAEAVFAERGFAGATTEEIARRARTSKSALYNLFGDKEALFRHALAARLGAQRRTALPAGGEPRSALAAVARDVLAAVTDPKAAALLRVAIAEAARSAPLKAVMAESLRHDELTAWLLALRDRGALAFEDPDETAAMFLSLAQGEWTVRALYGLPPEPTPEALDAYAAAVAERFLRAFAPPRADDGGKGKV